MLLGPERSERMFLYTIWERPLGHGRPRQKSWMSARESVFPAGLVTGTTSCGLPDVRVKNVCKKSDQKVYGFEFSSPSYDFLEGLSHASTIHNTSLLGVLDSYDQPQATAPSERQRAMLGWHTSG